jgi:hypothetical protein
LEESDRTLLRKIRWWMTLFIVGLVLSGLTAFPLQHEMEYLAKLLGIAPGAPPAGYSGLRYWIATVREGVQQTNARYPFMAYGTDWLAFAHLILAILFIGPLRDPVRNRWVTEFGLIACAGVIPLAMICGAVRGIPLYWRLIDCSFGVIGAVPLLFCLSYTVKLEEARSGKKGREAS